MRFSIKVEPSRTKEKLISPTQLYLGEVAEVVDNGDYGLEWVGGYCWRFPGYPSRSGELLCSLYNSQGQYSWIASDGGLKLRRLPPGTAITFTIKE